MLGERGIQKLNELLRKDGSHGAQRGVSPRVALEDERCHPFAVRWAQSVRGGDGGWIIHLPTEKLLTIDGDPKDVTMNLEQARGAYPEGWYLLDDSLVKVKADDAKPKVLYLTWNPSGGAIEFTTILGEGLPGKLKFGICDLKVEESGERIVRQFITSAIYLNEGDEIAEEEGRRYHADEASISLSDSTSDTDGGDGGNIFQLFGFGKYESEHGAGGSYVEPTVLDLSETHENIAFVARVGNSEEPNENTLGYFILRGVGGGLPGAWRIETGEDGTMRMVDCFYTVGNVTYQHSDVDLSALVGGGSGVVAFKYTAAGGRDAELYSSISDLSEAQRVYENMIVPLYRFVGGKVATDLRCAPKIQAFEVLQ